jgi:hypothetical protein
VEQPIGGGVQDQPHLIGPRVAARRAIGGELCLVQLDEVLRLAAATVDDLVEMLGAAPRLRARGCTLLGATD